MIYIIIGNVIAFIACSIMVYAGYLKQKNKILFAQTTELVLAVISNIFLGGITGAIVNTLGCIRNILCYKEKLNNIAKIIIITIVTVLSLAFNNLGIIGILPVISMIIYILFMNVKDVVKFKWLIIISMILWLVYDTYIKSYISAGFDFMNIVVNIISIIQIKKKVV